MPTELNPQPIPRVAFIASIAFVALAVWATFMFPERELGLGVLIWITAVIPAFLLAYARGLGTAAVAIAAGMAAIAALQAALSGLDSGRSADALPSMNGGIYLAVAIGMLALVELLYRERRTSEQATLVDRLTGLPTRLYADLALEQEFAAAGRGHSLTLVAFDIDNLAAINSRFGHPAGDAVIRAFAGVLKANTRKSNLSARYEGGRFVSVLRDADAKAAMIFSQRVLDQMREVSFPWGRQTASAGISEYEAGMGTYELLVEAADRTVHRAKEGGRDSVHVAPGKEARAAMVQQAALVERERRLTGSDVVAPKRHIYVVDDDAALLSLARGTLAGHGYSVWGTDSPAKAVQRFSDASPADRPVAIVADMIMPAMTGMRMMELIAKVDPSVRVVYMSGFVHDEISWTGFPGGRVTTLVKPFEDTELLAAVNRVLTDDEPVGTDRT